MKEQIIYKALELFRRYGVKAISMDDIARELSISKKNLCGQFKNKEAILITCIKYRIYHEGIFNTMSVGLLDLLLDCVDYIEQLTKHVDRRVFWDICKYYNNVYLFLAERMSDYARICRDKVREGINQGYVRKDTSSEFVYTFLVAHLVRALADDENELKNRQQDFWANTILVFARGIATAKGRTYIDKELKKRILNETC